MKIQKTKSRNYNGKNYYKYRIEFNEEILKKSNFKEGNELTAEVKKGEIKLKKK